MIRRASQSKTQKLRRIGTRSSLLSGSVQNRGNAEWQALSVRRNDSATRIRLTPADIYRQNGTAL